MFETKVVVVGGAPGAGKTTLAGAIARRLGCAATRMDDLHTTAVAITTPVSHPNLHSMRRVPAHEYFTRSSVDALIADSVAQDAALWPAIEAVICRHATLGPAIVLDGWFVTPRRMAELNLSAVFAVWLVLDPAELER